MNAELKGIIDRIASLPTLSAEETDKLMTEALTKATTTDERSEAGKYLRRAILRRKRPDVNVKALLGEHSEMLNLAYIAKRYFGKDRTWLYQRLNGSLVNGKPASFTENELRILSDSLADIGSVISKTSLLIHQTL